MDIRCTRCGEPWDMDSLHEEAETRFVDRYGSTRREMREQLAESLIPDYQPIYQEVRTDFRERGCAALFGANCNVETIGGTRARTASVLTELAGDDIDGLASDLELAEMLGI